MRERVFTDPVARANPTCSLVGMGIETEVACDFVRAAASGKPLNDSNSRVAHCATLEDCCSYVVCCLWLSADDHAGAGLPLDGPHR